MIKHSIAIGLLLSIFFSIENHAMEKKRVPGSFFEIARSGGSAELLDLLPNASGEDIIDAFKLSAAAGNVKTFKILFSKLKEVVAEPDVFQKVLNTGLYGACRYDNPEIVLHLIKAGADIHSKKTRAINTAIRYYSPKALNILLAAGAKPDSCVQPTVKIWQEEVDTIIAAFEKDKPVLIVGKDY